MTSSSDILYYYTILRRCVHIRVLNVEEYLKTYPENLESLLNISQSVLNTCCMFFESGSPDRAYHYLDQLIFLCNRVSHVYSAANIILFNVNRILALGHVFNGNTDEAINQLQRVVSDCPMIDNLPAPGIVDSLLILSELYGKVERYDEATQSARLAVDIAQTRLEATKRHAEGSMVLDESAMLNSQLGPMIDPLTAVSYAYVILAKRLEETSTMGQVAVEWYQRAHVSAKKFNLDPLTVHEFWEMYGASKKRFLRPPSVLRNKGTTGSISFKLESTGVKLSKNKSKTSKISKIKSRKGKQRTMMNVDSDTRKNSDDTKISSTETMETNGKRDIYSSNVSMKHPQQHQQQYPESRPKSAHSKLGGGYGQDPVAFSPISQFRISSQPAGSSDDSGDASSRYVSSPAKVVRRIGKGAASHQPFYQSTAVRDAQLTDLLTQSYSTNQGNSSSRSSNRNDDTGVRIIEGGRSQANDKNDTANFMKYWHDEYEADLRRLSGLKDELDKGMRMISSHHTNALDISRPIANSRDLSNGSYYNIDLTLDDQVNSGGISETNSKRHSSSANAVATSQWDMKDNKEALKIMQEEKRLIRPGHFVFIRHPNKTSNKGDWTDWVSGQVLCHSEPAFPGDAEVTYRIRLCGSNSNSNLNLADTDNDIVDGVSSSDVRMRPLIHPIQSHNSLLESKDFSPGDHVYIKYLASRYHRTQTKMLKDTSADDEKSWVRGYILAISKDYDNTSSSSVLYDVGYIGGETELRVRAEDIRSHTAFELDYINTDEKDAHSSLYREIASKVLRVGSSSALLSSGIGSSGSSSRAGLKEEGNILRQVIMDERESSILSIQKKLDGEMNSETSLSRRKAQRLAIKSNCAVKIQSLIRSHLSRRRHSWKQYILKLNIELLRKQWDLLARQEALAAGYKNAKSILESMIH